jgi:hypothetical protein
VIATTHTVDTVALWVLSTLFMAFVGFCVWQNRKHRVVDPDKPNEYNLRKISDLLQVPTVRRVECMAELFVGLEQIEIVMARMRKKLPSWLRWAVPMLVRFKFIWLDDGKSDGTIYINDKEIWSSREES